MSLFTDALKSHDIEDIRKIPKSDLHNHGMMGGRLDQLERFYQQPIEKFNEGGKGVEGINLWLGKVLRPVLNKPGMFQFSVESAFLQAKTDGVTVLEMSIDAFIGRLINLTPQQIVATLDKAHKKIAPDMAFRPELGFARVLPVRTLFSLIEPYLDLDYFKSIDLYDVEDAQPVENFREFFKMVKQNGLKCKAHAGEFGDAESVRKAVELLDLDSVQHGIGATGSSEVMKWLADRGTQLNVCPESNIILQRAESYDNHPIRILFDHGVKVTVNTDDVMLFNKGNSEQYLDLYTHGLFSAEELDLIRQNGIN